MVNNNAGQMWQQTGKTPMIAPAAPYTMDGDRDQSRSTKVGQIQIQFSGSGDNELRLRRGDGTPLWVQVGATAVRDRRGTITGVLAMVSDVSDRVRNRELVARLEQLQRLDSLGQLAGGIAHDFNNLLSIIGGFTELIIGDLNRAGSGGGDVPRV